MFQHGKNTQFLLNQYNLTPYSYKVDLAGGQDMHDSTVFGLNSKTFLPGLRSGSMTFETFFEPTTTVDAPNTVLGAALALDPNLAAYAPRGFTIGNEVYLLAADEGNYKISSVVADLAKVSGMLQGTRDSAVEGGVSLHALTAETASINSASVDNGASTASGGVGFLHVTAYSGFTNVVIKIQHSSDNVTFSDLIVFSTVTGLTSQRSTVTGTVNRYSRSTLTVTGTGSVTYATALARRA